MKNSQPHFHSLSANLHKKYSYTLQSISLPQCSLSFIDIVEIISTIQPSITLSSSCLE